MRFSAGSSTGRCNSFGEFFDLFLCLRRCLFPVQGMPFPVLKFLLCGFDVTQSLFQLLFEERFHCTSLNASNEWSFAFSSFGDYLVKGLLRFFPKVFFHLEMEIVSLLQLLLQRTTLL